MLPAIVTEDHEFWENNIDSSMGKLLFSDGILDMATGAFTPGFDPAIVFADRIDRPYYHNRVDSEACSRVRKLLFEDPFTAEQNRQGLGTYQLRALARTLAGRCRDGVCFVNIGDGHGKSLLAHAVRESAGTYFATFYVNSLTRRPLRGADAPKQCMWMERIKYKRGVFSNMQSDGKFDTCLFKTFVSGDPIAIRQLYKKPHVVRIRATPWINGNDLPSVSPQDDGVADLIYGVVPYDIRFTHTATGSAPDKEKRRNPAAGTLFDDVKYKDALLHLCLEAYRDYLREGHPRPPCVAAATDKWVPPRA
jgi:phage/plasmid-associated DNA primase